jgi:hypothetical protein
VSAVIVNVDNFVRAESNRMFSSLQADAGGVNLWHHYRQPTPLEHQPVIRLNRDTLYSSAVVDGSKGLVITIPDAGNRYQSVMLVNQDHYVPVVLHEPGDHSLSADLLGTSYAVVGVRILVDPGDPDDVAAVNELQDELVLRAGSSTPFESPDYDEVSFAATRQALLELSKGLSGYSHAFGSREAVDPVRHLIGSASAWGGLPEQEAFYANVEPGLPVGEYKLTVRDVPVDAFWSISVYDAEGFFEPNDRNANSLNSITATPDADGSITVHFGGCGDDRPNCLPIMEGWNYLVRLYRPHPEVIDGSWQFPGIEPA